MLFSSPSWFPPAKQVVVEEENGIEDEANSVWKCMLERKGLPSNTPYVDVASWSKDYHDTYLHMLKREKKRQKSINGIVYEDPELNNKKMLLTLKSMQANNARYHPACINMTDDEAKQIDSFTCDECRSLDLNQASSSADPDILETLKQQLEEQARAAEELVKADEELERAAEERQQAAEQARAAEERERAAKERQQAAEERQRAAQKRIKELEEQSKSMLT
ncbi:hypothetical protein CTI12_AA140510 [Artemisia annua]|uniref:Uncharacterized protein n=1 Tax=Artemisia annua TaxID=35608 RepID=A0A2U1PL22_ARTAN|nr:hypothetical protein CTI12_AA140510 [Artemisia annua]